MSQSNSWRRELLQGSEDQAGVGDMLPSLWNTRAHVVHLGMHMLTHTLHSGDEGFAWDRHSGQMLVRSTASTDHVTWDHLACGPVGSCLFLPCFPAHPSSHHIFARVSSESGTLDACFPGYKTIASGVLCIVALTCESRGTSRGFLYRKPIFPFSTV